jgi:hypothetical protein
VAAWNFPDLVVFFTRARVVGRENLKMLGTILLIILILLLIGALPTWPTTRPAASA